MKLINGKKINNQSKISPTAESERIFMFEVGKKIGFKELHDWYTLRKKDLED